jgi:hypothetical protein
VRSRTESAYGQPSSMMRARVPMDSARSGHGSEQGSGQAAEHASSPAMSPMVGLASLRSAKRRYESTGSQKGDSIDRDSPKTTSRGIAHNKVVWRHSVRNYLTVGLRPSQTAFQAFVFVRS